MTLARARAALFAGTMLAALHAGALAGAVSLTNLVSDDTSVHPALLQDPALVNAWGISMSATSPFWVSNNGTGSSTLYSVDPASNATSKLALTVTIPGAGNVTGQAFNGGSAFNADRFLFVSEDGTVSGWRGALGTTAEVLQTGSPGALYKGVALAEVGGNAYLYAANFRSGAIDVVKGNAGAPNLSGSFVDPNLPSGYAPFNIRLLAGSLYVTYAKQAPSGNDEAAGPGLGFVSRFDLNGNFLGRVASQGTLNAPWALTFAPSSFGDFAGALLVGNFGDGRINAYDPVTLNFLGQMHESSSNQPLSIDGLWALTAGNGGSAGSADKLYFTAGPDDEQHGLLGVLTPQTAVPIPEPPGTGLAILGLAMLGLLRRRPTLRRLKP